MQAEEYIVRSPYTPGPYQDTQQSLTDYLFTKLREGLPTWGNKPFIVDVTAGTSVKFCDLEDQSRRVASALSRRGFKKDDILYFVTYELAQLCVVQVAVWRLGGAVKGCFQAEAPEEYVRQLKDTRSHFVLVDMDTSSLLQEAISQVDWPVQMLSVGNVRVPGTTSFSELLQDDGSAMPKTVDINPSESLVNIPNTSGSTGVPKGVLHTHNTTKAFLRSVESVFPNTSILESMITYGIGTFDFCLHAICSGLTIYYVGKFKKETYFDIVMKYKPHNLFIYPYIASWLARCGPELARIREASFLGTIWIGGWVLDHTTANLLGQALPSTDIRGVFGMTEVMFLTASDKSPQGKINKLTSVENQGLTCMSSGKLLPYAEAKVMDVNTGKNLQPLGIGEIFMRSPYIMKGYMVAGKEPNRSDFDADGWFRSGDIGFFDTEGNLYILERLSFMFKYFMNYVSPCEIESVLHEHPAVLSAGVVGVPHPQSDSLAMALVVLRPGCSASGQELQDLVAQRLPKYKHLHGGVRFVDSLPQNKGGKLDRTALKAMVF